MPSTKSIIPEKVRPKPIFGEGLPTLALSFNRNVRILKKARTLVYTITTNAASTICNFLGRPYLIAEEYFSGFLKLSEILGAK